MRNTLKNIIESGQPFYDESNELHELHDLSYHLERLQGHVYKLIENSQKLIGFVYVHPLHGLHTTDHKHLMDFEDVQFINYDYIDHPISYDNIDGESNAEGEDYGFCAIDGSNLNADIIENEH